MKKSTKHFSGRTVACCSGLLLASSMAFAQQAPIAGITFKLGDDVQTVKSALRTNIDPEPMDSAVTNSFANPNAGKTVIFLRTKGIRVFFNRMNIAETIRFEAPFAGAVGGVKLGDSEQKVRLARGAPIKPPTRFGLSQSFQYAIDDTAYVKYDVTDENGVQTIFITK